MSISFQCPRCGKKLKAPDSAAGKASSCPGCGGSVTCPDAEVLEMQLTPVKPKGFDPFAEMDADKPYGVAAPPPSTEPSSEVLYAPPKHIGKPKSGKGKKKAELRSIATSQRWLILCILIQILAYIAYIASVMAIRPNPANLGGGTIAIVGFFLLVLLITGLAATVFAFMLTMRISNVGVAILVLLLTLIPCIGLIALLVVNGIATKRLRNSGFSVGFLGADMSEFS